MLFHRNLIANMNAKLKGFLLILIFMFISCGPSKDVKIVEIDYDTEKEIYYGLISELEAASEDNDVINLTEDEIYELADYIMPYIVDQIEKRGNEAIDNYTTESDDDPS